MDKTASNCFQKLQATLATIYESREADNIATIVFEDAFGIHEPSVSTQLLGPEAQALLSKISTELSQNKPWQYVLGEADFYGLKFQVDERVLIPRVETEELVHFIIKKHKNSPIRILDIGTGSGCIAVSLQCNLAEAMVTGVDISAEALALAQQNSLNNNCAVQFQQLDILDVKATKKMPKYHLIVSNPPYIQNLEKPLMPQNVLAYEPPLALFVTNGDPLQFYKAIAAFALEHLVPKGWLYFEINEYFGEEVLQLLEDEGFVNCQLVDDMFGKNRIVLGSIK